MGGFLTTSFETVNSISSLLALLVEQFSFVLGVTEEISRTTGSLRSSVHVVGLLLPLNVLIGDGGIHCGEVLLMRKRDSTATDVSSSSFPCFITNFVTSEIPVTQDSR